MFEFENKGDSVQHIPYQFGSIRGEKPVQTGDTDYVSQDVRCWLIEKCNVDPSCFTPTTPQITIDEIGELTLDVAKFGTDIVKDQIVCVEENPDTGVKEVSLLPLPTGLVQVNFFDGFEVTSDGSSTFSNPASCVRIEYIVDKVDDGNGSPIQVFLSGTQGNNTTKIYPGCEKEFKFSCPVITGVEITGIQGSNSVCIDALH